MPSRPPVLVRIAGAGDIRRTIPPLEEREALGKLLRQRLPRRMHGRWKPPADRLDPLAVIRARHRGRQQRLVPIRVGRMLASPFAFYRGSADLMARDLRSTASTGVVVQLCGDAHLSNFGVYASPERRLAFDINDFDETSRGRWEWDLKRLVASIELCGRHNGLDESLRGEAVETASRAYRSLTARAAGLRRLDVHYLLFSEGTEVPPHWGLETRAVLDAERLHAYHHTNERLVHSITDETRGRFRLDPPLLSATSSTVREAVIAAMEPYLVTASPDIRELLKDYGVLDVAHKVVGVGSVGTRDYVVMLRGNHAEDQLFLQVKEALPSVVRDRDLPSVRHHGERVVDGQRRIQSVSDPFLGWTTVGSRAYYVRQLRDMKGGVDPDSLQGRILVDYAELCGGTLAKAHARTGYSAVISSYCGSSARFDAEMVSFARVYADQVESDHSVLADAVRRGLLPAEPGI